MNTDDGLKVWIEETEKLLESLKKQRLAEDKANSKVKQGNLEFSGAITFVNLVWDTCILHVHNELSLVNQALTAPPNSQLRDQLVQFANNVRSLGQRHKEALQYYLKGQVNLPNMKNQQN